MVSLLSVNKNSDGAALLEAEWVYICKCAGFCDVEVSLLIKGLISPILRQKGFNPDGPNGLFFFFFAGKALILLGTYYNLPADKHH